jgi:hypothetical protein
MWILIYKITSPSGKSYIGQVIETKGILKRWKQHIQIAKNNKNKGSRLLNSAILKYGEENFKLKKIAKVKYNIKILQNNFVYHIIRH